jgi:Scaffold protein Nfu/NifU N terminal
MVMFIETETTPNPAALKFLPGMAVMPSGTREFATPEAAEASPLAEAIFDTGEVVNVMFGSDFVSVTAAPGADWSALKPQVIAILLDHFVSQAPLFHAPSAPRMRRSSPRSTNCSKPAYGPQWPAMAATSPIAASVTGWSI